MSSVFAKKKTADFSSAPEDKKDTGPFLSLNPKITDSSKLGEVPSPEVLEEMKKLDPKLQYSWAIWEQHKPSKTQKNVEYADAMKKTVGFKTVKEFWGCWNHLPQPSELLDSKKFVREADGERKIIDCLAIFREGVAPQWEDPKNENGGHFQLTLKPSTPPGLVDELWNNVVLGMIGGAIEPNDMLTGVRLVDKLDNKAKPHLRIEVWFDEMDEDTEKGGQGKAYDLRGSFERCIRIGLDGNQKSVSWGKTDTKGHKAAK
mmetsp:Transcript_94978/g.307248  ORF Transcript_94978/g.307248 Transcript_94978/m.307248 type:complete len:260 (-) Transcript_94978:91-870(-)